MKVWNHALLGCIIGAEVSWTSMSRYVAVKWENVALPSIVKRSSIFSFSFQNHADMMLIYEGLASFIFDKPILLNKYEAGMVLRKSLFESVPIWVQLPQLKLMHRTPWLIGKIASVLDELIMADEANLVCLMLESLLSYITLIKKNY